MSLNFLSQPYFQKLIKAICLTLMHSLWQGLLLAIAAGACLMFARRSRPALRYHLLSVSLLIFVLGNALTFWILLQLGDAGQEGLYGTVIAAKSQITAISRTASYPDILFNDKNHIIHLIMTFGEKYAVHIVVFWFLIFSIKSVQAATGYAYIRRIRTHHIHQPAAYWQTKFEQLSRQIGIPYAVKLAESELISIPMVVGFLKPIVLVPFGLLTNLSADQVEAILLHELAHIKRKDYLVNLSQIFCENVFFFNPAVLWVSSLIRQEREHCCDDLTISIVHDKTSLINALVSFQDYSLDGSRLAMTFAKKQNHLLHRIKRIIYSNNKSLNAMEKLFVTISLITITALSAAFHLSTAEKLHQPSKFENAVLSARPKFGIVQKDTLPGNKDSQGLKESVKTYEVHINDKAYTFKERNGEIIYLTIDGKEIPKEKIKSYRTEINKVIQDTEKEHANAEIERVKANHLHMQGLLAGADSAGQHLDQIMRQTEENRNVLNLLLERNQSFNGNEQVNINQLKAQAQELKKQAEQLNIDAGVQKKGAEELQHQAEILKDQAEVAKKEAEKLKLEYEKMQTGLINDLIQEGVIKDKSNLSYKLSNDELIVNGVKQSAALHQKLKAKYIKEATLEMVYNWSGKTGFTTTGFIYTK